jgi:2-keto-4-pentenoate hydratase/2-oxohepta-3-ene-1,7-dioic acid hydratase in catechol pathway
MRFARLNLDERPAAFAELDGGVAHLLEGPPWWGGEKRTGAKRAWADADLLCPVVPTKIVCIGRNYAAHAKEMGNEPPKEPLLFLKPNSALLRPGGAIVLPMDSARVEHEAELGVVIGRRGKDILREDALAHVFGYTCVGDITARDLQKKDGQWTRAKGFDTFCPVGPWIETGLDPSKLRVTCRVNGHIRQDAPTSDMIFDVASLIAYASRVMTLEPGDLIVTGTPEGVGPLVTGDTLEVEVSAIGTLAVHVG